MLLTLLATLVTLGVLVTIHEWGHFWVARRCGVKVLRFSVGFGKPLLSWRDKQGTEFAVAAIPLGGYVRMLDEREGEVPEALREQAFNNRPVLQRIAVVAAGPAVNLIFAVLAYWFLFVWGVNTVAPVVGQVQSESIAAQAGVEAGGELIEIDGRQVQTWEEVNLRLAARVGETGNLNLKLLYPDSSLPQTYSLQLERWHVDMENESPLMALGLQPFRPQLPPVLGEVVDGGRAAAAGLQTGDRVLSVGGQPVADWMQLVGLIQAAPEQTLNLVIERDGREQSLEVTPAEREQEGQLQGYVGAGVQWPEWPAEMQRTYQLGVFAAIPEAFAKTGQMITLTLESIWKMLQGLISVKNLSGPITIAKVAGASAASGLESFIGFLAYLSVTLGVLNLLPIPVLDGGHLLYYVIEWVRGKPVSEEVQVFGLKIGMALLLTLMTVAIFNDLMRL